jgi:hypothetical protein
VRVSGDGAEPPFTLDVGSPAYQDLVQWVEHNRTGWSRYGVTTPGGGTFVTAGQLRLQFLRSGVLAYTEDGAFDKHLPPGGHSFLHR